MSYLTRGKRTPPKTFEVSLDWCRVSGEISYSPVWVTSSAVNEMVDIQNRTLCLWEKCITFSSKLITTKCNMISWNRSWNRKRTLGVPVVAQIRFCHNGNSQVRNFILISTANIFSYRFTCHSPFHWVMSVMGIHF